MRTSPVLSSSLTFLSEWVFPAFFLLGWPIWIQSALSGSTMDWVAVIVWGVGCIAVLMWSWPIKFVDVEGDYFIISDYFTSHRVPIAHLANITENYYSRTPAIMLYFEPTTPFGKRVRILPPVEWFHSERFDEVMVFLRSLVSDHTGNSHRSR